MSNLAYVRGGTVIAVLPAPATLYPDIQSFLVACPDTVQANWTYDGTTFVDPATVTPTTIAPLDFIRRFTAAEQSALMAANPLWGVLIAAAPVVDVTDAATTGGVQAAVVAGALSQARANQVLNLAVPSP